MKDTYVDENIYEFKKVIIDLLQKENIDTSLITNELVNFISIDSYNMKTVLNKVKTLVIPKELASNNLLLYLDNLHRIISSNVMCTYFYKEVYPKINIYNLNKEFYNLIKTIKYYGDNRFNDFIGNLGICTLIIGYIYENNINDYKMLDNFLNNQEYYYEKMKLSGINFNETELNEFYLIDYQSIYKEIENIFKNKEDKIYIK